MLRTTSANLTQQVFLTQCCNLHSISNFWLCLVFFACSPPHLHSVCKATFKIFFPAPLNTKAIFPCSVSTIGWSIALTWKTSPVCYCNHTVSHHIYSLEVKQEVEYKARKKCQCQISLKLKPNQSKQATWHCLLPFSVKVPESCMQKLRKYHSIIVHNLF